MSRYDLCPSALSGNLVAAFDFHGDPSSSTTDQAGTYSLAGNNTPQKRQDGVIGSGVLCSSANSESFTMSHADLIRFGSAWTRMGAVKLLDDWSLTTSRQLRWYYAGTAVDRLMLVRNNGAFADPYLYFEVSDVPDIQTFDASALDDWIVIVVTTDGSTTATAELRTWSDWSLIASGTVAQAEDSHATLTVMQPSQESTAVFDNFMVFDKALSADESESIWRRWRDQRQYMRGIKAGRANQCLSF